MHHVITSIVGIATNLSSQVSKADPVNVCFIIVHRILMYKYKCFWFIFWCRLKVWADRQSLSDFIVHAMSNFVP